MLRRKVLLVLTALIGSLALPLATMAAGPHLVSGLGAQVIGPPGPVTSVRSFAFSALSSSSGRAFGLGAFDIRRADGTSKSFVMSIESVAVEGKQSVLIGRILYSTDPAELGIPAFFGVEDNGEGRKQKKPDRSTIVLGFIEGDAFTPDYTVEELSALAADGDLTPINFREDLELTFDLPLIDLVLGNIVVR